jgi:phosphinothricin acetyltransferase
MNQLLIRPATELDAQAISDIYNHFVLNSTCTYQEEPERLEERLAWMRAHGPQLPVLAAEMSGQIVGWGSLSRFHARSAYRFTVENSVYVRHDCHRLGIGRAILTELITSARNLGYRVIIAGVSADQTASLGLHRALGFADAGLLRRVGRKFGRELDVAYLQYDL